MANSRDGVWKDGKAKMISRMMILFLCLICETPNLIAQSAEDSPRQRSESNKVATKRALVVANLELQLYRKKPNPEPGGDWGHRPF